MAKHLMDSPEVRKRAAEIQSRWSPLEKILRTGLPPDIPERLRQYILGPIQREWSTVSCGARKTEHPLRSS